MDLVPPDCLGCKHFRRDPGMTRLSCAAFPDGIPAPIIESGVKHLAPYPGDHGLRFEADPAHPMPDIDALLASPA